MIGDSELVAKQVTGAYKVKHAAMKPLHAEAMAALGGFERWSDPHRAARAERRAPTRSSTRRWTGCDGRRARCVTSRTGLRRLS